MPHSQPTPTPELVDEVYRLASACLEDAPDEADRARLERMLVDDPVARRVYIDFMQEADGLRMWAMEREGNRGKAVSDQRSAISRRRADSGERIADSQSSRHTPCAVTESEKTPIVRGPLSVAKEAALGSSQLTTDHGHRTPSPIPHSAIRISQSLSRHPLAFSCFVATLTMTIILMTASQIPIGRGSSERNVVASGNLPIEFVARITGNIDCVWGERAEAVFPNAHLRPGQVVHLESGLAEVTFKSGAVAVVEGPAVFTMEGTNRGRLERGRLVARVEKKSAKRFTIETPTATIVDLGTEFGVSVGEDGVTELQVYVGKVQITERVGKSKSSGISVEVSAGEMVRSGQFDTIQIAGGKERRSFQPLRNVFLPHSQNQSLSMEAASQQMEEYHRLLKQDSHLAAYFPFYLSRLDAVDRLRNNAPTPHGASLDVALHGVGWGVGRWPGSHALKFDGPLTGQYAEVRGSDQRFNADAPLTIAVWFQVKKFNIPCQTLASKGESGWRIHRRDDLNILSYDSSITYSSFDRSVGLANVVKSVREVNDGRWRQVVCVYEPLGPRQAKFLMYLDGRLENTLEGIPYLSNDEPVVIGSNSQFKDRIFFGNIDELSIFAAAISPEDVERFYAAGNPYLNESFSE